MAKVHPFRVVQTSAGSVCCEVVPGAGVLHFSGLLRNFPTFFSAAWSLSVMIGVRHCV